MAKTLVDEARSLVEEAKARKLATRRAAADELRTLLLRNEKPKPGDEGRLIELMEELSIEPERLPEVLELVKKLDAYETLESRHEEIHDAHRKAQLDLFQVDEWEKAELARISREATAKREEKGRAVGRASIPLREIQESTKWASTWNAQWALLRDGTVAGTVHEQFLPMSE